MKIYLLLITIPAYMLALYVYNQRNKELFYTAFLILSYLCYKFFMPDRGAFFVTHSVVIATLFSLSIMYLCEKLKMFGKGGQIGETTDSLKTLTLAAAMLYSLNHIEVISSTGVFVSYFSWLESASLVFLLNSTVAFVACRLAVKLMSSGFTPERD